MPHYRATASYGNDKFFVKTGDVIEMDANEAERLNRDSPGTFEAVTKQSDGSYNPGEPVAAEDVLSEHGAAVKAELEAQIPTIDLDVEDKAKEIPGAGNKYTPASGYHAPETGVRVVERAPSDRQQKGASKRGEGDPIPADLSANARVTDSTPASLAADEALLEDGVLANADEDAEDEETKKKNAASKSTKKS